MPSSLQHIQHWIIYAYIEYNVNAFLLTVNIYYLFATPSTTTNLSLMKENMWRSTQTDISTDSNATFNRNSNKCRYYVTKFTSINDNKMKDYGGRNDYYTGNLKEMIG